MTARLLTAREVAELTGLSSRSVYRAVDAGELIAYRLRGRLRIPEAALDEWLAAHRVTPHQRARPAPDDRRPGSSEIRRLLLPEDKGAGDQG